MGEGRTCSWRRRCIAVESYADVLLDPGALRLIALAERCAHEPASRQLDGEIYNAVHNIEDFNLFPDDNLWEAKRNGQETVGRPGWRVVAPRWKAGEQPNRRIKIIRMTMRPIVHPCSTCSLPFKAHISNATRCKTFRNRYHPRNLRSRLAFTLKRSSPLPCPAAELNDGMARAAWAPEAVFGKAHFAAPRLALLPRQKHFSRSSLQD